MGVKEKKKLDCLDGSRQKYYIWVKEEQPCLSYNLHVDVDGCTYIESTITNRFFFFFNVVL